LRLIDAWNDPEFRFNYYKLNQSKIINNPFLNGHDSLLDFSNYIYDEAADLDIELEQLSLSNNINSFFEPLIDGRFELTIGKYKYKRRILRIYALKIDDNCYIITGGGIKITKTMNEDDLLKKELIKLNQCQDFLKENGIDNIDTLYEFVK
jgi:hypothetical protein